MKRISILTASAALTAALASPLALSQQTGTDATSSSSRTDTSISDSQRAAGSTSLPSTSSADRPMSQGHSGSMMHGQHSESTIRQVQQALKDKGLYDGEIDGMMGPKTEQALQKFQQQEGLSSSTALDHETLAKLNISSAGAAGSQAGISGSTSAESSSSTSLGGSTSSSSDSAGSSSSTSSTSSTDSSVTPPASAPQSTTDTSKGGR